MDTNAIERVSEFFDVSNQLYIENLSSQITSLLDNLNLNTIFEQYDQIYEELDSVYHVDQQKMTQTLNEYQWFVLPEMPIGFVFRIIQLSEMDKPRERINQLFLIILLTMTLKISKI